MTLEILFCIGLAVCAFLCGYHFAMFKICECMSEIFNTIDCENKEPQFLKGVFFVSDHLKRVVK